MNTKYTTTEGFLLRLEARLKNAKLVGARESLGLTQKEVALALGISVPTYGEYETLKHYPSPKMQKKICDFYRRKGIFLFEEDVFPEELRGAKFRRKITSEASIPKTKLLYDSDLEKRLLPSPEHAEDLAIKNELEQKLMEVLSRLNFRQQQVIKMRYGLGDEKIRTHKEIAEILSISATRVSQIEKTALHKLRDPALTSFLEA